MEITEFPDNHLIEAITNFQKVNNLKADGVMKPDGETENTLIAMGGDGFGPFKCNAPIPPKKPGGSWAKCTAGHGGAFQYCRKCMSRLDLLPKK